MNPNKWEPHFRLFADELRHQIDQGILIPGQKLPSIRELSSRYNLGRQVVLSAFKLLTDEGLIKSTIGSGTIVSPFLKARTHCRIAYIILEDTLNNIFYGEILQGLQKASIGTKHEISAWEHADLRSIKTISADCYILTGLLSKPVVEYLEKNHKPYIILGNYLPDFWKNNIYLMYRPLIRKLLNTDKTHKKTVGVILDNAAYSTNRIIINEVEYYSMEKGLSWNSNNVLIINQDMHESKELQIMWNNNHNWPQRIITTQQVAFTMLRLFQHVKQQGEKLPELLIYANNASSWTDLPDSPPIYFNDRNSINMGIQLLPVAIRVATGELSSNFTGAYNPVTNTLQIQPQQS